MKLSFVRPFAVWLATFAPLWGPTALVQPGLAQIQNCGYDTLNPTLDHARNLLQQQKHSCAEQELLDILRRVPTGDAAITACAHLLLAETYFWQQERPDRSPQVDTQLSLAFAACRSCPCKMATTDSRLTNIIQQARNSLDSGHTERNNPPRFASIPSSGKAFVGQPLSFRVHAEDFDHDKLAFSIGPIPGAKLEDQGNGSAVLDYTPPVAAAGQKLIIQLYVTDGHSSDSARINVSVSPVEAVANPVAPVAWSRSLIVPGWPQHASGRRAIGVAFFGAEVVALGTSVALTLGFNSAVDEYNQAYDNYRRAPSQDEATALWSEVNSEYQSILDARKRRNIAYVAAIVVYGVNVADAYVSGRSTAQQLSETDSRQHPPDRRPRLKITPNGLYLCLAF